MGGDSITTTEQRLNNGDFKYSGSANESSPIELQSHTMQGETANYMKQVHHNIKYDARELIKADSKELSEDVASGFGNLTFNKTIKTPILM